MIDFFFVILGSCDVILVDGFMIKMSYCYYCFFDILIGEFDICCQIFVDGDNLLIDILEKGVFVFGMDQGGIIVGQ